MDVILEKEEMKEENKLREKYGDSIRMKVPDGYFQELPRRIDSVLPPYPEVIKTRDRSRWENVRPYVYLAAMFCGIWLMMKVFHNVTNPGTLNLDNPPEALVELLDTDSWDNFVGYDREPEFMLEEEVSDNYDSIEDFENDFGYVLKPEYSQLKPLETTDA